MSDRLETLLASKNCREVCEAAVRRLWTEELAKRRSEKEADKAVRAAVHQMTGAFLTPEQLKTARGLLGEYLSGHEEALDEALRLHASTRERLPCAQAFYAAIFEVTGRPERILDLARRHLPPAHAGRAERRHGEVLQRLDGGERARWIDPAQPPDRR